MLRREACERLGACDECVESLTYNGAPVPIRFWRQRKVLLPSFHERLLSQSTVRQYHFEGPVQLDAEGWMSLTPASVGEEIARQLADLVPRVSSERGFGVLDLFCGCGGNAIAFAREPRVSHVVTVDVCRERLAMAAHNASRERVAALAVGGHWAPILFLHADAVQLLTEMLQAAGVASSTGGSSDKSGAAPAAAGTAQGASVILSDQPVAATAACMQHSSAAAACSSRIFELGVDASVQLAAHASGPESARPAAWLRVAATAHPMRESDATVEAGDSSISPAAASTAAANPATWLPLHACFAAPPWGGEDYMVQRKPDRRRHEPRGSKRASGRPREVAAGGRWQSASSAGEQPAPPSVCGHKRGRSWTGFAAVDRSICESYTADPEPIRPDGHCESPNRSDIGTLPAEGAEASVVGSQVSDEAPEEATATGAPARASHRVGWGAAMSAAVGSADVTVTPSSPPEVSVDSSTATHVPPTTHVQASVAAQLRNATPFPACFQLDRDLRIPSAHTSALLAALRSCSTGSPTCAVGAEERAADSVSAAIDRRYSSAGDAATYISGDALLAACVAVFGPAGCPSVFYLPRNLDCTRLPEHLAAALYSRDRGYAPLRGRASTSGPLTCVFCPFAAERSQAATHEAAASSIAAPSGAQGDLGPVGSSGEMSESCRRGGVEGRQADAPVAEPPGGGALAQARHVEDRIVEATPAPRSEAHACGPVRMIVDTVTLDKRARATAILVTVQSTPLQ